MSVENARDFIDDDSDLYMTVHGRPVPKWWEHDMGINAAALGMPTPDRYTTTDGKTLLDPSGWLYVRLGATLSVDTI